MKDIKVLGTGCAKCKSTVTIIEQVASAKGIPVRLEKIEDMQQIVSYGVMSTPSVVIDGKVVHSGGIPTRDKVEEWLSA
ncbi:thioredoxin family protein [Pseudomonas salmasensis]|uniref:thioredoxin family protein n=1 Tax=Pseudomonas salmasensis TaxID=2745514 RepID=UPI00164934BA|nr:thioredoxin family protein [Pseudomonas salmasensis]QXH75644.1 TM0996/MTH895 family glutaredoxin-like protein [Pseudomonas salmasensis]